MRIQNYWKVNDVEQLEILMKQDKEMTIYAIGLCNDNDFAVDDETLPYVCSRLQCIGVPFKTRFALIDGKIRAIKRSGD